jgi:hypothetical protein
MHVIQQLTPDFHEKWNDFVIRSPQGGLFQTTTWVEMLCETDDQDVISLPLACLEGNDILGGMIVRYRISSGKKVADLPAFGYNGPAFSPKLHDPERRHTYKTYTIFSELLKALAEELDYVVFENQPEIWDARAYKYQSWRIGLGYTHLWQASDPGVIWNGICPDFQKLIRTSDESFDFKISEEKDDIQKFVELYSLAHKEIPTGVMRKRIEWMFQRDNGRLHIASDKFGETVGMVLVILSRENQTAYLWDTVCNETERESEVLPYLFFQSHSALTDQFRCIDLGKSSKHAFSEMKDKLGCELTPLFIARYQG